MSKSKKLLTISFVAAFVVSLLTAFTAFNGYSAKADETLSETNVAMRVGASVRIEDPAGIRFRGEVNAKYFTDGVLNENYTVGMLIVPSQLLEGELTVGSAKAVNKQVEKFDLNAIEDVSDGMVAFNVAMVDVPEKYYTTDLTARAYVYNGEKYEYSAIENMQTRSIGQVASIALSKGRTDALLTTIVNSCNPSFTIADSEEDEVNITAKIGDTINISATPANFIAKVDFNGDALSYDNKNVITVSGYSGEVVTAKVSLGKVEKTLNVNIYTDETELKLSEKLAGIKYNAGETIFGEPVVSAYIENDEPAGFYFGAETLGSVKEIRSKYKVPVTLEEGHKYKFSFKVDQTSSASLWGDFYIGLLDIITLPSTNAKYSPSMWGYANNADAASHATVSKYAESVTLKGSNSLISGTETDKRYAYTGSAEFIMTSTVSEVWLDVRMTNAVIGNNALIKEISLVEDENYVKEKALKTLLDGIGTDNFTPIVYSPSFKYVEENGEIKGVTVVAGNAALRFQYKLARTLEEGKTYKLSFTVNEIGETSLWGSLGVGILNVVVNDKYSPTMWAYKNNQRTAETAYAKNVALTGSDSGKTYTETATFTMTQTLNEITIDFNISSCKAGDLFTITAFNIEEVSNA